MAKIKFERDLQEFTSLVEKLSYYDKKPKSNTIYEADISVNRFAYDYRAMVLKYFSELGLKVIYHRMNTATDRMEVSFVKVDDLTLSNVDIERFFKEYKESFVRTAKATGYWSLYVFCFGATIFLFCLHLLLSYIR